MQNGTLINNVSSGFDNITLSNSTNNTTVYKPNIKVIKLTNNPIVFAGDYVGFTIKVTNTGDCKLNGVLFMRLNMMASNMIPLLELIGQNQETNLFTTKS